MEGNAASQFSSSIFFIAMAILLAGALQVMPCHARIDFLMVLLIFEIHEGSAQARRFRRSASRRSIAGRLQDVLAPAWVGLRIGFRIAQPLDADLEQQLVFVEQRRCARRPPAGPRISGIQ